MKPTGIYTSNDLMTYISRSAKFRLWSISMVKIFVVSRLLSSIDGSKMNDRVCCHSKRSRLGVGLEVNM